MYLNENLGDKEDLDKKNWNKKSLTESCRYIAVCNMSSLELVLQF